MKQRYFMKKLYAISCMLMAVSLTGCYLLPEEEKPVELPELIESDEALYQTTPVVRGDIEDTFKCNINIEAKETVAESFVEGGKVAKFYYMKGEQVEEGDLLAEIETIDYQQQIAEQEIVIKQRALDIEKAKAILEGKDESDIKAIKREIEDLKEDHIELEKMLQVNEELLATGSISESEVDKIKRQIKDNEEAISDKTEALEDPNVSNKVTKEIDLAQAQLDYESAVLRKTNLEEKLARTKLYASVTGTITYFTNIQEGETIGKGEKVYQIAKKGEKRISYQGTDTDKFKVGDHVNINANEMTFDAEVIETPATTPFEVRTKADYKPTVYFKFNDPEASDYFVTMPQTLNLVKVLDSRENVLIVPTTSILFLDGKTYIYILENGIRVQKPIVIGLSTAAYTEIVSGLNEGELVII